MLVNMKHRIVSKSFGKGLMIGGGVAMFAAFVGLFATLQSVYGLVGTCDTSCTNKLDTSDLLVHAALWVIVLSAVVIIAGVLTMHYAKSNKETSNK